MTIYSENVNPNYGAYYENEDYYDDDDDDDDIYNSDEYDDDLYDGDDDDDAQSARAEICVGGTRVDYHYDYDRDDFDH